MNRPAELSAADDGCTDHNAAVGHMHADLLLQQALRSLPSPLNATRLDALQARVLAQWQVGEHRTAPGSTLFGVRGRTWALLARPRRGSVLASGLFVGVSLATVLWLQRPDPVLDDLLQPDVLSQLAIGAM